MRLLAIGFVLVVGSLLGGALLFAWPINFGGAVGLVVVGYACGRVHESEIQARPVVTVAPLPRATARDRSVRAALGWP